MIYTNKEKFKTNNNIEMVMINFLNDKVLQKLMYLYLSILTINYIIHSSEVKGHKIIRGFILRYTYIYKSLIPIKWNYLVNY